MLWCLLNLCGFTADSKHDNNGQKKTQEKRQTTSCTKPLTGKVFYLDLPSNKRSETLENDIQTLGGVSLNDFVFKCFGFFLALRGVALCLVPWEGP